MSREMYTHERSGWNGESLCVCVCVNSFVKKKKPIPYLGAYLWVSAFNYLFLFMNVLHWEAGRHQTLTGKCAGTLNFHSTNNADNTKSKWCLCLLLLTSLKLRRGFFFFFFRKVLWLIHVLLDETRKPASLRIHPKPSSSFHTLIT